MIVNITCYLNNKITGINLVACFDIIHTQICTWFNTLYFRNLFNHSSCLPPKIYHFLKYRFLHYFLLKNLWFTSSHFYSLCVSSGVSQFSGIFFFLSHQSIPLIFILHLFLKRKQPLIRYTLKIALACIFNLKRETSWFHIIHMRKMRYEYLCVFIYVNLQVFILGRGLMIPVMLAVLTTSKPRRLSEKN